MAVKAFARARERLADTVGALVREANVRVPAKVRARADQVGQYMRKGVKTVRERTSEAPQATRRVNPLTKASPVTAVPIATAVLVTAAMLLRLFRNNR